MAKCPKCKKEWKWDWCQDTYRTDKFETPEETEFCMPDEDITATVCVCQCGKILAVQVVNNNGGYILNCKEWENIEWEDKEHAHDCG